MSESHRGHRARKPRHASAKKQKDAPQQVSSLPPPVRPSSQVAEVTGLSDRAKELAEQLVSVSYECPTCMDVVGLQDPIWSCECCHAIFHLRCAQQWDRRTEAGFVCPFCRTTYMQSPVCTCFCGRVQRPKYDPFVIPHSCGNSCGRRRPYCQHKCIAPCHPGPCIACAVIVGPKPCPCGSTTYTYRCGERDPETTCDNVCGRLLNCGQHRCTSLCHTGACQPCQREVSVRCKCGKETRTCLCGSSTFECGKPCGKTLRCGNHTCPLTCHDGACPPCDTDPSIIFTCPCGQTPLTAGRSSCLDDIPTCDRVCGRALACGRHSCEARCHSGACEPCGAVLEASCQCRQLRKKVPCRESDALRCTRVCGTPLSCGKHRCAVVCCVERRNPDAGCHHCTASCPRKLPCGHECTEPCHRGPCPPCIHVTTEPLFCHCHAVFLMPPQPCGTAAPTCGRPCIAPRPCGHAADHVCHFGDCPPCQVTMTKRCAGGHCEVETVCSRPVPCCLQTCHKPLGCGHLCAHRCHDGECGPCSARCTTVCADCGEACGKLCHAGAPCPPCTHQFTRQCGCGNTVEKLPCHRYQLVLRKHRAEHPDEPFELACTSECVRDRFNVFESRALQKAAIVPQFYFSILLWEAAEKDLAFIEKLEHQLKLFLASTNTVLSLIPRGTDKRAVEQSLCVYYRIRCDSVDTGANRASLLTKTTQTHTPPLLLSAALKDAKKNDPRRFFDKPARGKCLVVLGDTVSERLISQLLHELVGQYVFGGLERCDEVRQKATLKFVTSKACAQAEKTFAQESVTFRYWAPTE